jgi:hypothetical protein
LFSSFTVGFFGALDEEQKKQKGRLEVEEES